MQSLRLSSLPFVSFIAIFLCRRCEHYNKVIDEICIKEPTRKLSISPARDSVTVVNKKHCDRFNRVLEVETAKHSLSFI